MGSYVGVAGVDKALTGKLGTALKAGLQSGVVSARREHSRGAGNGSGRAQRVRIPLTPPDTPAHCFLLGLVSQ